MMKNVRSISTLARASSALAIFAVLATLSPALAEDKPAAAAKPDVTIDKPIAAAAKPAADEPVTTMGRIAVVDLQMLVNESKAGKSIREQLEAQRNSYRSQIEKQEADLSASEKELVSQQSKLSKEDFAKKRKEFQEKVVKAQRGVQERRIAFDKAYTKAMETLRENIVKIVADLAGKERISLVLNRQEVVLVDAKLDFSKQVLKTLDEKLTTIPVTVK